MYVLPCIQSILAICDFVKKLRFLCKKSPKNMRKPHIFDEISFFNRNFLHCIKIEDLINHYYSKKLLDPKSLGI